jgi:hypothetical protein
MEVQPHGLGGHPQRLLSPERRPSRRARLPQPHAALHLSAPTPASRPFNGALPVPRVPLPGRRPRRRPHAVRPDVGLSAPPRLLPGNTRHSHLHILNLDAEQDLRGRRQN